MKKAIVTGANGFIGAALCRELSAQNISVIAVVRDETAKINAIKDLPNLSIIYCDMSRFRNLGNIINEQGAECFYNLAWHGSAGPLRGNCEVQVNNIRYTCDAVKACKDMGCKRFVFASSIMEYEITAIMGSGHIPNITTLYSSAKVAADYMARTISGDLGIEYIRGVISNIYGPGETSPRLINTIIRKLLNREHCSFSTGEQIYDFIYIDDAVKTFVEIGKKGKANKTYYIGSQNPRPLREFLCELRDQIDPTLELGLGELLFHGLSHTYTEFDIYAVEKDTGFIPAIPFDEGIRRTIEWMKEAKK